MSTKNSGCYYAMHFGCLNAARHPNCDGCAERLTNAVNYVLHSRVSDTETPCTWTATFADGAAETREEKAGVHILRGGS